MMLSNIMRYVTDDMTNNFVPLQNELDCIADFIELNKLRIGEKTSIYFKITGEASGRFIPPLVFITFIENLFKYGISSHEPSGLSISVTIDKESIKLFCQNL